MEIKYRKSYEVVGYAYEADLHCLKCTEKRFGSAMWEGIDAEDNPVHPFFLDSLEGGEVCSDCLESIK